MRAIAIIIIACVWCQVATAIRSAGVPLKVRERTIKSANSSSINTLAALKVSAITWNLAEKSPSARNARFIREISEESDLLVVGVQECETVKPRRREGRRSRAWRELQDRLLGNQYKRVLSHRMGGMQLAVYARRELASLIEGHQVIDVACGIGNMISNKGAICAIIRINGKSLAFINAHLAAHQNKVHQRNADCRRIFNTIGIKAQTRWLTKPHADRKRHVKRFLQDSRSPMTASIISRSVPMFEQTLASLGIGSAADLTTTVTAPREYSFSKMEDMSTNKSNDMKPQVTPLIASRSNPSPPKKLNSRRKDRRYSVIGKTPLFDSLVFMGDLNYRMDLPRPQVEAFKESVFPSNTKTRRRESKVRGMPRLDLKSSLKLRSADGTLNATAYAAAKAKLNKLLEHDQLRKQLNKERTLHGFSEGDIEFMPSFKYDKGRDSLDSSAKMRAPAWTDRILYSVANNSDVESVQSSTATQSNCSTNVEMLEYSCVDSRHSDHRPVFARFKLNLL